MAKTIWHSNITRSCFFINSDVKSKIILHLNYASWNISVHFYRNLTNEPFENYKKLSIFARRRRTSKHKVRYRVSCNKWHPSCEWRVGYGRARKRFSWRPPTRKYPNGAPCLYKLFELATTQSFIFFKLYNLNLTFF